MNIELREPSRADRERIRRMMELYLYDFSEYEDTDVDEHGLYGYDDLDYFWHEPTHAAFVITVNDKLAGFVLVDDDVIIEGCERTITEFFVMKKYRRQGVGKHVACAVFDRLPARWDVQVLASNTPAQAFWRTVIAAYTDANYQEIEIHNDGENWLVFSFDNRDRSE